MKCPCWQPGLFFTVSNKTGCCLFLSYDLRPLVDCWCNVWCSLIFSSNSVLLKPVLETLHNITAHMACGGVVLTIKVVYYYPSTPLTPHLKKKKWYNNSKIVIRKQPCVCVCACDPLIAYLPFVLNSVAGCINH